MPTLTYTGTRNVAQTDANTTVPKLAEQFVNIDQSDSDVEFREASMTPGRNGSIDLQVSLEVSGSYGMLATIEGTLAQAIVDAGFETDAETAKQSLDLG